MKTYKVTFQSTTEREYEVKADNKEDAEQRASEAMYDDDTVSKAWHQSACTIDIDELIWDSDVDRDVAESEICASCDCILNMHEDKYCVSCEERFL